MKELARPRAVTSVDAEEGVQESLRAQLDRLLVRGDDFAALGLPAPQELVEVRVVANRGEVSLEAGDRPRLLIPVHDAERMVVLEEFTRLLEGLVVVPTAFHLMKRDADRLLGKVGSRGMALKAIGVSLRVPEENLGNLYGALRLLGNRGWLLLDGCDEQARFSLTEEGSEAFALLRRSFEALTACVSSIPDAAVYQAIFSGRPAFSSAALDRYAALVTLYRERWHIDAGDGPVSARAAEQLILNLNGVVLCPTLVALGMPYFEPEGDRLVERHSAPAAPLVSGAEWVSEAQMTPPLAAEFWKVIRALLESAELVTASRDERGIRLTPRGSRYLELAATAAMPCSYLRSYGHLEDLLFGNPDPLGVESDGHIDRVMNIYGASQGGATRVCPEVCSTILAPIFDELPLHLQPAGIADMGCGDGFALKRLAEFIVQRTRRGKHLQEFPLLVVGADYYETPRARAREVLADLDRISGVRVAVLEADIARPDLYDRAIRDLGFTMPGRGAQVAGANDLLHSFFFLTHGRGAPVITTRDEAKGVFASRMPYCDQERLRSQLKEIDRSRTEGDLVDAVMESFQTSFSDLGRLQPAAAAAADLVHLLAKWSVFAESGLIIVEFHDPAPQQLRNAASTRHARVSTREKVPYTPVNWGTHYLSRQFPLPFPEHLLALTVAGLVSVDGMTHGGFFDQRIPSLDRIGPTRFFSIGFYRPFAT